MDSCEQQVWQRVLGQQEIQQTTGLKALAMEAREAAREYRQLSRVCRGKQQTLARALWEAEEEAMEMLRGLHYLQTGETLRLPEPVGTGAAGKRSLMKRYHETRRRAAEYLSRSGEPEWGQVFRILAKGQEDQCARIAGLLGCM